jgi:ubiquinone/menaquinone biosynthesis C-methylase UbiE
MATAREYVPAAGQHWLLPFYDPLLALFTRERTWRGAVISALDMKPGDLIADVGCGTGTLAVMAKEMEPRAEFIGIDPDPKALARAERKAKAKSVAISFHQGFGEEIARIAGAGTLTKVVSSMVFHHMPHETQVRTIAAMRDALQPGGAIRIADFISGHFNSTDTDLVRDLTAGGFANARVMQRFRILGADTILVGAEKP